VSTLLYAMGGRQETPILPAPVIREKRTGSRDLGAVPVNLKATRELWPSGLWDERPECSGSVHLLETLLHANAC
jgi:hypothetical protein